MPSLELVVLSSSPPSAAAYGATQGSDDRTLVEQSQQGDVSAFSELVRRHQSAVQRHAFTITRNDEDAQDVAQDAMLIAWRRLHSFRGECAFTTWMYAIVTRLALNRVTRRPAAVSLDDRPELPDPRAGPAQQAESSATGTRIRRAVGDLPTAQARAITMHHFDGLSYADIARITHTTEPAVRSHMFRGRRQLACVVRELR